jgi:hypothetical protein
MPARSKKSSFIASALPLLSLACGGQTPDDLGLSLRASDASVTAPADATIPFDAGHAIDAALPTPAPTLGAPASCVGRDATLDAGPSGRCESSRDCASGAICCAPPGATIGQCSTAACAGATSQQRCLADCECLAGRCRNAWPYMPYGDCG